MRIRWTPAAAADLRRINDYLERHGPHYRLSTMRKLYESIQALRLLPQRGRIGSEAGTRELLFLPLPYIAVYRVTDETVEILRIYHGAQNQGAQERP